MFNDIKENMNIIGREMENIKNQMELIDMK